MTSPVLPTDIFRLIIGYLSPLEVQNARLVCKEFYELSKLRSVWNALIHRHALHHNIPIPGLPPPLLRALDTLSALELEKRLLRALRLRQNWTSAMPVVKRRFNLDAIVQDHRIVSVHLLPNGKLVSYSVSQHFPRTAYLRCWDIDREASPAGPKCVAARELRRSKGTMVDKTSSEVRIAVTRDAQVNILSFDPSETSDPENAFVTEVVDGEANYIHFFAGTTLITGDAHDRIFFWDTRRPEEKAQLQNPHLEDRALLVRDVVVTEEYILLLRTNTLELYRNPSSSMLADGKPAVIHPAHVHQWPWRIDIGLLSLRRQPKSRSNSADGIYIVMRYGSYFPWSINLLHHYELRANPIYLKGVPVSNTNVPFDFPPVLQDTIASPVRLHAISDLAIGPYGTAVWTDSHTEDYFDRADQGQRLAGKFFPFSRSDLDDDDGEDEGEGIELSDQVATAAATSVYAYHEGDNWVSVAVDETEGRIALGRDDGSITVLEYV
ncbi:hypothetical protein CPC08DRAFT_747682 [Agrocybe pediades]|nr:hypothetical protein CPC08DRAFT_747682 [Agrocybe pediades]